MHYSIKFDTLSPKQQIFDTQMQLRVELLHRQDKPTDQWTGKDAGLDRGIETNELPGRPTSPGCTLQNPGRAQTIEFVLAG